MQDPRSPHLQAAYHLLRYLKKDPILGVHLSKRSWLYSSSFLWLWLGILPKFKKVRQWLFSTTWQEPHKLEIQETRNCFSIISWIRVWINQKGGRESTWLHRLLIELTVPVPYPIDIYYDSQSAIHIARNRVFHERTKHIEVDCHCTQQTSGGAYFSTSCVHV